MSVKEEVRELSAEPSDDDSEKVRSCGMVVVLGCEIVKYSGSASVFVAKSMVEVVRVKGCCGGLR